MKHKKCGTEIIELKNEKTKNTHPFFIGYCPKCNYAVPKGDVEE